VQDDFTGFIAMAMSVIVFVTVWVKIGVEKGRQTEIIEGLGKKTEENKLRIAEVENKTHGLELRIAEFMGEIKVTLGYIEKAVNELKPKGGRRAAEK